MFFGECFQINDDQDMDDGDDDSEEEDDDDDDDDDEDDDVMYGSKRRPVSRRGGRGGSRGGRGRNSFNSKNKSNDHLDFETPRAHKSKPHKRVNVRSAVTLDMEQMIQNCILYFLVRQHKKLPVKKADIVKYAMNGQFKDFPRVYKELSFIFEDTFGIRLIQLEIPEEVINSKNKTRPLPPPSFIIVSKFDCSVAERNTMRSIESLSKRAVLFLILCVVFMLNKPIDEEMVWTILTKLSLDKIVCKQRIDLGKFLRTEYVTPHYLKMEESMEKENVITRYSWGQRSQIEFSTYGILKFVAEQFPGKSIADYPLQYNIVVERDKETMEADRPGPSSRSNPDGENGSAIHVNHDHYTIDSQVSLNDEDSQS